MGGQQSYAHMLEANAGALLIGWPILCVFSWVLYFKSRRSGWLLLISCIPYVYIPLMMAYVFGWAALDLFF